MNARIVVTLALFAGIGLSAQQPTSEVNSPKQVVEKFVRMEVQGRRLTSDGWREASVFFVRPDQISACPKVLVIGENFNVWDPVFESSATRARVDVEIVPKGHIDSKIRFGSIGQSFQKNSMVFHLNYQDRQAEVGESAAHEPGQWRIEGPNDTVMLSTSAAMRYVRKIAEESKDPVIRKNAAETLTKLEKLN